MNSVIDQRGEWATRCVERLDDMAARIVQLVRVIVISDLSFRLAGGNLELRRLQPGHGVVNCLGHPLANALQIFGIAGGAALAIGESVTIGRAVGVRGANENASRSDRFNRSSSVVTPHPREAK